MDRRCFKILLGVICIVFPFYSAVTDSKGAIYKSIISGGGGLSASIGNKLIATIGQPVVGSGSSNSYSGQGGMWSQDPVSQSIIFPALTAKMYGDDDLDPGAVASSGLTVTYTSSDTGVATIVAGKIRIVGAGSSTITARQSGNSDYDPAPEETQVLTVTPASLTVMASNRIKPYGSVNPVLSIAYLGFVNGDTPARLAAEPIAVTTATTASAVGSYPITATGGVSDNYSFIYVPGVLTVTPAVLTVTANSVSKTYGAANPALTLSFSGFVNGDTTTSVTTQPTATTTATVSSAVGNYPITAAGGVSGNYSFTYVPGTLDVTPAELTVTASSASKTYGMSNPPLTVTYAGFVNGDTAASLAAQATAATTATSVSPVGTYPITATGGVDSNYTFRYIPGTLTVNQAATNVILSSTPNPSPYGSSVTLSATVIPSATGTITFMDNGTALGTASLAGGLATYTTSDMTSGTHEIAAIYGGEVNFTGSTSAALIQTVNAPPLNGACGSSNEGTFTTAPTNNLCSAGAETTVTGSGPWTWHCNGTNGGTSALCSADIANGAHQVPVMDGWWLAPGVLAGVGMLRKRRKGH